MGILNITTDSFFEGSRVTDSAKILSKAATMLEEGATFLDIGGYSTRPGAQEVSVDEELKKVIPAIEAICKEFPEAIVSIDTFRSKVAQSALEAGASMINDISGGGMDEAMLSVAASHQVPYIMMHMRGTPHTMMDDTEYDNITTDVLLYFSERLAAARAAGINDVIVDPGFGFSKTLAQNFELFDHLEQFQHIDAPLLVGISRKSMIYKTLKSTAFDALNGTTALHSIALEKGASILRAHDVKEAVECITLWKNLKQHSF
ncbi:dihydropteroate synthase [Aureisphaera galaxeae]|nr:dihydropteroate synthase [Aureisphaera galaxeae]MDC8006147.1 dihydropteroate synthase [Aureisphaera galaxeae]